MKTTKLKILIASALLFMTASAQALQPEVLYAFQLGLRNPAASLVQGRDGHFYGTTGSGGSSGYGTVFRVTTNGVLTSRVSFNGTNGRYPQAELAFGNDGNFYGTTAYGGSSDRGTMFKVTANGVLTTLISFAGTNGALPLAGLVLGDDGHFYGTTYEGGSKGWGTVFQVTSNGVLTMLVSFNVDNGASPNELVLGSDGHFYGTTRSGGSCEYGTVFQVTTNGVLTSLVSFPGADGAYPQAGLVLGRDGNFYGTTAGYSVWKYYYEGATVFQVTTNGVLTTLVSFNFANGLDPSALVLGSDGHFYGTTAGFFQLKQLPRGTVFQVTTNGVLTTLLSFTGTNGAYPRAGLVLGRDGHFYGTTAEGGSSELGTVFQVTTNGVLTSLVPFNGTNGANPWAGLVVGNDGHFYGTTVGGGSSGLGTVFKVTTSGLLTSLVSFNGANGAYPQAKLLLGSDGNFYGTTSHGGSTYVNTNEAGYGTVFRVTTNGVLTSLVSFTGADGAYPRAGLVLGRDGYFYGTTSEGGPGGGGTIFRLIISAFTNVARQPSGSVLLTGTGPANGSYRLWARTDLSLPITSWTLLTSASFDSNGNFSYTDAGAATSPSRFYQLSVP